MKYDRILSVLILAGTLLSGSLCASATELYDADIQIIGIEEVVQEPQTEKNIESESSVESELQVVMFTESEPETSTKSELQTETSAESNSQTKTPTGSEPQSETPAESDSQTETPAGSELQSETPTTLAEAAQGLCKIASACDSDYVLDVRHCTVRDEDSRTVQLYHSLNVNQQKFYLEALPDGAFRISVLHTGDVLTALPDHADVAMTAMELPEGSRSAETQTWRFEQARNGFFYIKAESGQYLTLGAFHPYAGAPVILSEFTGGIHQMWQLSSTWISPEDCADTDLVDPYGEDGPYNDLRITLLFGTRTETITADDLSAQTRESDDHELIFDADAYLDSFIERLAATYDTQGQPKRFRTSYGNEITLREGDFGWKLDQAATKALLLRCLETDQARFLRPIWAHEGISFDDNGIGDSYIEVDLENQKVFFYKDGKKLLETDCVSGTAGDPERETPGGVYNVYYMNSPDTLDGPGYSEEVTYWMPFYGGYGLHDATWRTEFGKDIYKTNGSHGCINLPLSAARRIYKTIEVGYPVVLYK